MNSKFNLQFFGGYAQIWRQKKPTNNTSYSAPGINFWGTPKNNTQGSMSYSAPGIIVRRIGKQGQSGSAVNNGVVNDLANIVRTRALPQRYTQVRAAI